MYQVKDLNVFGPNTPEFFGRASSAFAGQLVVAVEAVPNPIADVSVEDARAVLAQELLASARLLVRVAVGFVGLVLAVVVQVANQRGFDALAVLALELPVPAEIRLILAAFLVLARETVLLPVTSQRPRNARIRGNAMELRGVALLRFEAHFVVFF